MSSLPIRKDNSILAEAILKCKDKDLFLFVEDENLNYMYEKVVNKLFGRSLNVKKIFPLKNKRKVLLQFSKWIEAEEPIKSNIIFLVDKDFDHLLNKKIPAHKNLVELEYYTIENYIISKEGAISLMKRKLNNYDNEEVERLLDWDEWFSYICTTFEELFIHYGIAHKFSLKENCRILPYKYFEEKSYKVKVSEVEKYIDDVSSIFLNQIESDFHHEYCQVKEKFIDEGKIQHHKLIKGKYLLVALFRYISYLTNGTIKDEDLATIALVEELPKEELYYLKSRIEAII